jgi:hypothetical protein
MSGTGWTWRTSHYQRDRLWALDQIGGFNAYYAHHLGIVTRYQGETAYTAQWCDSGGLGNDFTALGEFHTLARAKRAVEAYQRVRCPRIEASNGSE